MVHLVSVVVSEGRVVVLVEHLLGVPMVAGGRFFPEEPHVRVQDSPNSFMGSQVDLVR